MTGPFWQLRKAAKCSRKEAATKAGLGDFRLWLIEADRVAPTRNEAQRLQRALRQIMKERSAKFRALLEEITHEEWLRGARELERSERLRAGTKVAEEEEKCNLE